jgi:hypothetical protein
MVPQTPLCLLFLTVALVTEECCAASADAMPAAPLRQTWDKPSTAVNCGGHYAETCRACPTSFGEVWCHGDCTWVFGSCEHNSARIAIEKEVQESWWKWSVLVLGLIVLVCALVCMRQRLSPGTKARSVSVPAVAEPMVEEAQEEQGRSCSVPWESAEASGKERNCSMWKSGGGAEGAEKARGCTLWRSGGDADCADRAVEPGTLDAAAE